MKNKMNKKIYEQPSTEILELKITGIMAGSYGPSTFNIIDDHVDSYEDHEHEVETSDIWGKQW